MATNTSNPGYPLERILAGAVLLLLLLGSLLVLRPFVSALLWALVLCSSSWSVYSHLLRLLRNRRSLAAFIMTMGMVLLMLLPFAIVGLTLADNIKAVSKAVQHCVSQGPTAPPEWLAKLPVVGQQAAEQWQILSTDTAKLLAEAKPFIERVSGWLLKAGLALGGGLVELALSILIAFFLFRDGVSVAGQLTKGIERIAGERGIHLLTLANKTVRGVVYGILGTSLAQALIAGLGFLIAGVPGPIFLGLLTFFASVIPVVGTALVWVPAALWLFNQGSIGWAVFMVVWGLVVANVDNVIKPWLISQGSDMPFILIFFGVIGGALAFGFIGVFLGPTLLAVAYRLITEWLSAGRAAAAAAPIQEGGTR